MKKTISRAIYQEISRSHNILLCCHPSPDGDGIGSSLAFYWYLTSLGKNPTVIKGDSELPNYLSCLPGYSDIVAKNYFEIDLADFDLFIILDSSSLGQISKTGDVNFPKHLKTIVIDHHGTNSKFGAINLIDDSSPATCQIVYQLFKLWRVALTPEIALNLFVGIYSDTGGFKYSKTTAKTFNIAANLVKICPKYTDYIFKIENSNDPGQIIFKGLALSSIKLFYNNRLAVSVISYKKLKKFGLYRKDTEKSDISNILKSVIGWDIGICLVETEPGICTLSLRRRDSNNYDLGLIAKTVGNGGGHEAAAGSTIHLPITKAVSLLVKTIAQLYPEITKN